LASPFGVPRDLAFDPDVGVVGRVAFDKDQLRTAAHLGCAIKDVFDVAGLVARRHDHRHHWLSPTDVGLRGRSGDDEVRQRRRLQRPQPRQIAICESLETGQANGQQDLVPAPGDFEVGQTQQVVHVLDGEPVLFEQRFSQSQRARDVERQLPQSTVEVEDEPRARPGELFQLAERDFDVPQVVDHVRQDDHVERLILQIQPVRIGLDKAQLWMAFGGTADHAARNIHSESERWC